MAERRAAVVGGLGAGGSATATGRPRDHRGRPSSGIELGQARLELRRRARPSTRPVGRELRHRTLDRHREARRASGRRSRTLGGGSLTCLIATATKLSPGKGTSPVEELVEDDAERVDVRQCVDPLAPSLLGRDVVARPEHGPGLRHAFDVDRPRDAEVGHLRLPVLVQKHVLRLHVAVDEPRSCANESAARDLERELDRSRTSSGPSALDQLLQVLALDVLEDDELAPVLLAAVDDRDDVRMRSLATERASRRKRST